MRYLKFSLLILPILLFVCSCSSNDSASEEVLRPYQEVYNEDIAELEKFMDEHTMTVDADYNVTITKITAQNPGQKIKDRTDLTFKTVRKNDVDYKLYYIKLREGSEIIDKPTKLDSVFTSYKGFKTDLAVFDQSQNPNWFTLDGVIAGWTEIMPEFNPGTFAPNQDGTTTFNNFGAGVMFIPSGLAYYNRIQNNIGQYQPIMFSFKLMRSRFRDHDGDKILSKDEYGPLTGDPLNEDGDNFPDYRDLDDDNDAIFTKDELSALYNPSTNPSFLKDSKGYYVFSTIPLCNGSKKRHLDKNCK